MKRILVLECGMGFGGALTSLRSFLDAMPSTAGWEFHVLTTYPQDQILPKGVVKAVGVLPRRRLYGNEASVEKALRLLFGARAGNVAFLLDMITAGSQYAIKVTQYIKKKQIHLVHLNNSILINDAGLYGARLAKVPSVVHIRGPEYKGRISSWLAQLPDHFLPVSRYVAGTVAALGVSQERITVVPEGLDVERFAANANGRRFAREVNLPEGIPVIGMVGCLVGWKGHEIFLDACQRVMKRLKAVAVVVGDTPDGNHDYRTYLQQRAQDLGIKDKVYFAGHRDDIASAMSACDVVVHASTAPEPFGRVILEAMAVGKAVVAINEGGPCDIIEDGVDGLLVPSEDSISMAESIQLLLENPVLRGTIGERANKKVQTLFTIQQHVSLIDACYRQLLFN